MSQIINKKFIIFSIFFSLITIPQLANPLESQINGVDVLIMYHEDMKGIVVAAPNVTYKDIPYNTVVWNNHYEKILKIAGPKARVVINSPKYAYTIIQVQLTEYNKTVSSLRNFGFFVRDEAMGRLLLNESVSAIKAPYVKRGGGTLTGANRIIAIVDSGIDCSHPDFNDCVLDNSGKILNWYDAYEVFSTPRDLDGHGTHVASIAAGTGAASGGKYTGVAPGASLLITRACAGGKCPESMLIKALKWVLDQGNRPDVISLSLGYVEHMNADACSGLTFGPEREIYDYIQEAINREIVVVAAAGNTGVRDKTVKFPACINNVIAVGATFKKDYGSYSHSEETDANHKSWFHVIINVSGGYTLNTEFEWLATSDLYYRASGFIYSFISGGQQTHVRVRIEGKWKSKTRNFCFTYDEGWEPGGSERGDAYWEWNKTFYPYSTIVINIGARPIHEAWAFGICWHTIWNNSFNTIRVRIYEGYSFYAEPLGLKDQILFWSGRGPAPQGIEKPDVVAPGYEICAARATGTTSGKLICDNDQYISASGTSVSTPHVAGLVALLKEANSASYFKEIISALKKADATYPYERELQGRGRINTIKAVNWILGCRGDVDGNRKVDIYDVVRINGGYGSRCGDIRYYPDIDLTDDCKIDIYDVVIATNNYGAIC